LVEAADQPTTKVQVAVATQVALVHQKTPLVVEEVHTSTEHVVQAV